MPIDIDAAAEAAFTRLSAPEAQPAEDTQDDSVADEVTDEPNDEGAGTTPADGQLDEPADTSDDDDEVEDDDAEAPRPEDAEIPEDALELDSETTFVVEVDGKRTALTGDELRAGYLRHADYTRKRQEEAAKLTAAETRAAELESQVEQASEAVQQLQQAEEWFQERAANPTAWAAEILTGAADGDPSRITAYLGKSIMDLANAGLLTEEFVTHFGINTDSPVGKAASDGDLVQRLDRVESTLTERERAEQERAQAEEQREQLVAEYRRQWDDIVEREGLQFETPEAEAKARGELATFAVENQVDNLLTAWLLLERERSTATTGAVKDKIGVNGKGSGKEKATAQGAVNRSSTRSTRTPEPPAKDLDEAADRALNKLMARQAG